MMITATEATSTINPEVPMLRNSSKMVVLQNRLTTMLSGDQMPEARAGMTVINGNTLGRKAFLSKALGNDADWTMAPEGIVPRR